MNDFITQIPLIRDLSQLVEWLLLLNVLLTGAVILLAFRLTHYKHRVDELEKERNQAIGLAVDKAVQEQPARPTRQGRKYL